MSGEVTTRRAKTHIIPVTIAAGEATSAVFDIGMMSGMLIQTPNVLTHATMNFLVATTSNGTFATAYTNYNVAFALPCTIARTYLVNGTQGSLCDAAQFVKIQMGTAGTPATEAAERTFYIIGK